MRISLVFALLTAISGAGLGSTSLQTEKPRYRPVMPEQRRKALDQLKKDLSSPETEVRRRALRQAKQATILTPEGRRLAETCLKDVDAPIRLKAAQRLIERRDFDPHPDLQPVLLALLDHPEDEIWRGAYQTVRQWGRHPQGAVPIFRRWLTQEDKSRRMLAVMALVGLGHPPREELPKLIAALPTARNNDRFELVCGIGSFGHEAKSALPNMVEVLKTDEGINREQTASIMMEIDPACQDVLPYFLERLQGKDLSTRIRAIINLDRHDKLNEDVLRALAVATRDADEHVRMRAATALLDRGAEAQVAIPDLIEALQYPPSVNSMQWQRKPLFPLHPVAVALEGMGQTAVPALQAALKHPLPQVRVEAAWTLARLRQGNRAEILTVVREQAAGRDQRTAQIALRTALALDETGDTALPLLVEGLKSKHLSVRWFAMKGILRSGEKARRFLPDIQATAHQLIPMEQLEAALVLAHQEEDRQRKENYRQEGVAILASSLVRRFSRDERLATKGQEYLHLQRRAILYLGELGPRATEAVEGLLSCLEDDSLKLDAARALGLIGPSAKEAIPALRKGMAQGPPTNVPFYAAALVQIDPTAQDALDLLLRHACQGTKEERHYALGLLGRLGPQAAPHVAPMLVDLSEAEDQEVYSVWVRLVGWMGPHARNCIPFLERQMVHVDAVPSIPVYLLRIDPQNATVHTFLRTCLRDGRRDLAYFILGEAGPAGRAFLPEVQADLKSPDRRVRRQAATLIQAMETEPDTAGGW